METTGGSARGGWGTAAALFGVVLFLAVLNAVPLVVLPLALLLLALPGQRSWRQVALGALLAALALALPGGPLGPLSQGWALLLGGGFLLATVSRPGLGVLPRALLALGLALAAGLVWLAASGGWAEVDGMVREHLRNVAAVALRNLGGPEAGSEAAAQLAGTAEQVALLQWRVFPAILGLQSLGALALAAWWAARIRRDAALRLRPLREFRFHDQLVWVLVAGLVLVSLPLGALATRVGYNALLFMGGLYAVRGVGVFVFLAGGAPSLLTILFGALAAIFLYPLVLTAAVLVGLGDTWFDVRERAALAPRA